GGESWRAVATPTCSRAAGCTTASGSCSATTAWCSRRERAWRADEERRTKDELPTTDGDGRRTADHRRRPTYDEGRFMTSPFTLRRSSFVAALGGAGAAAGLGFLAYAGFVEPRQLRLARRRIAVPGLPP